jgi:hypothetical protein
MLKLFKERPPEITINLNPYLGSLILWEFVCGYETNSKSGVPYLLIFFPMSLVLHKETRLIMPHNQTTRLRMWINNEPQVKFGLAERISQLSPFAKEALLMAVSNGLLEIDENGIIKSRRLIKSNMRRNCSLEVKDILEKSSLCGKLFGQVGDITTIFLIFGVKT